MTELYDNTRLTDSDNCQRFFYYRHERHWSREGISYPLLFGLSWHNAMDAIWTAIAGGLKNDDEVVALAIGEWMDCWLAHGGLPMDQQSEDQRDAAKFRHEETAYEMIYEYVKQRRAFIEGVELLAVEKPFAVPIDPTDPNLLYIGRRDKDVRWNGAIWSIEHKTSSLYRVSGGFANAFIESFSPNSQVDGYNHSLHMDYPGETVKGVMVDAALVHGKVHDKFMFIPIERSISMLDAWLWEVHQRVERVRRNRHLLEHESSSEAVYMAAFPKNTSNCIQFGSTCPYHDLCRFMENPMRTQSPPPGFIENKWEPFDVLKLAEIGVKPEAA